MDGANGSDGSDGVEDWIGRLADLSRGRTPAALVTVTACTGSTPREVGAKMIVLEDGGPFGTVGGGRMEQMVIDAARRAIAEGTSRTERYPLGPKSGQCCGGAMDIFIDVLNVGPRLYLFGAGNVGHALAAVLAPTPFRVHLVDERPDTLRWPDAPPSIRLHGEPWDVFADGATWDDRTYVAVMTHRHDVDQAIVADVVRRPARYVGLIGSETKWKRFQARLTEQGYTQGELARVRCPIGLDIGGKSPQEVAISVAAELLRVHHGR